MFPAFCSFLFSGVGAPFLRFQRLNPTTKALRHLGRSSEDPPQNGKPLRHALFLCFLGGVAGVPSTKAHPYVLCPCQRRSSEVDEAAAESMRLQRARATERAAGRGGRGYGQVGFMRSPSTWISDAPPRTLFFFFKGRQRLEASHEILARPALLRQILAA